MNLLDARLDRAGDGAATIAGQGWTLALDPANSRRAMAATGPGVVPGGRHSTLILHAEAAPGRVPGRIYTVEPTGDLTYAHVNLGDAVVVVSTDPQMKLRSDQPVWIAFDQARLHLFDAETRQRLPPSPDPTALPA